MNSNTHISLNAPTREVGLIFAKLTLFVIAIGALLRLSFIFHPITSVQGIHFFQWISIFTVGIVNDAAVAAIALLPMLLMFMSAGRWKYASPQRYVFIALLCAFALWMWLGAGVIYEFNRPLYRILKWVSVYWLAIFCLRAFVPAMRNAWTRFWLILTLGLYVFIIVFNAVGEWFFWNEFGVRYNFIAVDYLIYTSEVIGNIQQSYSMGWIVTGIASVSIAITILLFKKQIKDIIEVAQSGWRPLACTAYVIAAILGAIILTITHKWEYSGNKFATEMKNSGIYSFYRAFLSNSLDYKSFYPTISDEEAEQRLAEIYSHRSVAADTLQPKNYNIVIVTMESMSADYMEHFGGSEHLTPTLDSLYSRSLAFERLFANGNRTVRGLEALTLSRPPAPGESIIKRDNNSSYPSTADALDSHGYRKMFFYGGDSYFDNMEPFFKGMGYEIHDSKTFSPSDVEFKTVWGICDEDVFAKMVRDISDGYSPDKPFLAHVMTTSNHRPYTYPEGKISIPPSKKSRNGGVMYADYSLSRLIEMAKPTEWFDSTIFVIVADHCASSAGSVDIPLESYHIPALFYAPAIINPQSISAVCSQIDLMPTLFALMGWEEDTNLYGTNVLAPGYQPRAFVATYQDMGYLDSDTLTILSPGSKIKQYRVDAPFTLTEIAASPSSAAARRAITLYQSTN